MGILDNLLGTKSGRARAPASVSREPKYVELEWGAGQNGKQQTIRVIHFNEFSDVEGVLEFLRNRNNILILKVKPRLVQEKMELKRALKRIQRTVSAIGGDIAGIDEKTILVAPPSVEIARESESMRFTDVTGSSIEETSTQETGADI